MARGLLILAATLLAFSSPAVAQPDDLQGAVLTGDVEAVQTLIVGGADINEQSELGTPLHVAALKDNAAIAVILLDKCADKEIAVERTGMRPLHVAASYDRPSVAAVLLDRGATVDAKEVSAQPRALLASVAGLELVEMADSEVICGFGGTFCVKYPEISTRMVSNKVGCIDATGADLLLAGDLGCLMNMAGRLKRLGSGVQVRHAAEVLAGDLGTPAIGEGRS